MKLFSTYWLMLCVVNLLVLLVLDASEILFEILVTW